jgi:hypothetical protein
MRSRRLSMFAKHGVSNRFGGVGRVLTSLFIIMGLALIVLPTGSLAAPATVTSTGTLQVHVTNYQNHTNLQGALVTAIGNGSTVIYRASTNRDGLAKFPLIPNTYSVKVAVSPYYEPWTTVVRVDPSAEVFVDARVIFVPDTYHTDLLVLDAKAKVPVSGASVRIYDNDGQTLAQGTTSSSGSFAATVPPGVFFETVMHPKFEAHKDFVRVIAGQSNSTVVGLAPLYEPSLGDMQIHALDAYSYLPVEGASVTLYDADGKLLDQGITDAKGIYYTCLPEGKYKVVVTAPKYMINTNAYTISRDTPAHYKALLVPQMAK